VHFVLLTIKDNSYKNLDILTSNSITMRGRKLLDDKNSYYVGFHTRNGIARNFVEIGNNNNNNNNND